MESNNLDVQILDYLSNPLDNEDNHFFSAKLAILDTIGCIVHASSYDNVHSFAAGETSVEVFNNPFKTVKNFNSILDSTWYLTVLTRWFDYNDTFLAKEWGHPSDNFGTIYTYFQKNHSYKFVDFTTALTKAYEIQGSLCLGTSLNKLGFDHVFFVKLASGSVFSYLLSDGNSDILKRTVNNILMDGPSLRAYRHFPNVGKRKSWAAADAARRGIELSQISGTEDEIYDTIQNQENWGFENTFMKNSGLSFGKDLDDWVIQNVLFKVLYPAEFHGQSAVEAATQLSSEFSQNRDKLDKINIHTHEPAVRIISNKKELKNASDRDHSLEYMVAAALLYGDLKYEMYEDNFSGLDEINELRKKIHVQEEPKFTQNYYEFSKRHISNSIEILYNDNTRSEQITIENPIGHPSRREEAVPLLKEKFIQNVESIFSLKKAKHVWNEILNLKKDDDVAQLFSILIEDE
ncbi:MmgE/PrpD family protein [Candidatus Actinomarina]|nr:MmgE/PrpD family protein [Candidatus Actinomarina sp.]